MRCRFLALRLSLLGAKVLRAGSLLVKGIAVLAILSPVHVVFRIFRSSPVILLGKGIAVLSILSPVHVVFRIFR